MDFSHYSKAIRKKIITIAHKSKSPHVGSCLSCVDLLTILYFYKLRLDTWSERDIFILSKGHSALALYSTLAEKKIIGKEKLEDYYQNDGSLPGHLDRFSVKGIEVSAGSLGHGFNMGLGMAYGFKKKGSPRAVYTIIGDGETQEGSIWEGALFAPALHTDNFTALLDYNNLQGYGRARDLCAFEPVSAKWEAFGWYTIEIDGHNFSEIQSALDEDSHGKPKIIIAHTVKGKGVSFMEDRLIWHYYIVTDEIKEKAMKELNSY
ncbi:MAG: transketolase [bacterium]